MPPIADAPSLHEHFGFQAKVQELIDAVNGLTDAASTPSLKFSLVAGAAKETNITITGIKAEDEIISVLRFDLESGGKLEGLSDLTSEAAIKSTDHIQLSTTVTTGDKLLVIWNDKSGN